MKTPEEKLQMIREQVISKIHWGADRQEVADWLQNQHYIMGPQADQLLTEAFHAKARVVRGRAVITLVFSAIGLVLVLGYVYIRYVNGVVFVGPFAIIATILAVIVGAASIRGLFRSLVRLLTGDAPGSVD